VSFEEAELVRSEDYAHARAGAGVPNTALCSLPETSQSVSSL
jgi:hypothetical protein